MTEKTEIFRRKNDHIRINLEEDVNSGITSGLENIALEHCALPEISLQEVDLTTHFFGHSLGMPLMISSMTGGTCRKRTH